MSREERDEIRAGVDEEFDAKRRDTKKKKTGKGFKGSRKSNDDELGSLFGEGISGKLPRFANKITLKVCHYDIVLPLYLSFCLSFYYGFA